MSGRQVWLAVKTPLTLLVLLAFVALVGNWAYKEASTPIPKRPPDPCVVTSIGPTFTAANSYIRIYNGTSISGLAKNQVKLVFGNAGFHVFKVGNADAPIAKTYVAGVDAKSPEVVLVMSYLPAGTPFVADAVKYQDHMVDIYLGADFKTANINPKPTTEIALPDGKACVPNVKALTGS